MYLCWTECCSHDTAPCILNPQPVEPIASMNIDLDDYPSLRQCPPKTRTNYQIARPPPISSSRRRLRIRPRLLLQLQQLSDHSRPTPALDVLPSSVLPARIAQRVPKIFRTRQLGPNDVLVTTADSTSLQLAQDCDVSSNSSDESEKWDNREMVGVICRPRRSEPQDADSTVCLENGDIWQAARLPRGGHQFTRTDNDGKLTRVRWMPKEKSRSRASTLAATEPSEPPSNARFVFSILKAGVRRHPVLAVLTKDRIEVQDSYAESVPQTPVPSTCTSPASVHEAEAYFEQSFESAPLMVQTDHHLRSLIIMTGLHVFFQEGWSNDAGGGAVPRSPSMTAGYPGQGGSNPARRTVSSVNMGSSHTKLARANTVGAILAGSPAASRTQSTKFHKRSVSETVPPRNVERDFSEQNSGGGPQLRPNNRDSSHGTGSRDASGSDEASTSNSRGALDEKKDKIVPVSVPTKPKAERDRKRRSRFRRLLDTLCFSGRSQRVRT